MTDTGSDLQAKKMAGEAHAISSREGSSGTAKLSGTPTAAPWHRAWAYLGKKMLSTT